MLKVALRGVFARKLRAFLTALAVFLGVALMTGTYVLTDTFTNSFGQIFEESKEWFSLYGVNDSAQPATYDEFERYLADVLDHQLVANKMSEISTDLAARAFGNRKITKDIGRIQGVHPMVARCLIGPFLPLVGAYVRLTTLGSMGPHLRDIGNAQWSVRDERHYRRICAGVRLLTRLTERFVPYRFYYSPEAVAGFARTGIDPRDITLTGARAALARHRAARAGEVTASQ